MSKLIRNISFLAFLATVFSVQSLEALDPEEWCWSGGDAVGNTCVSENGTGDNCASCAGGQCASLANGAADFWSCYGACMSIALDSGHCDWPS